MLNACCGGIRPGHEDTKEEGGGVSGLHDMSTIELPVGHVKIDPEGSLFPFFVYDSNISLSRARDDDLVLSLCRLNANETRNLLLTYKYYFSPSFDNRPVAVGNVQPTQTRVQNARRENWIFANVPVRGEQPDAGGVREDVGVSREVTRPGD